MTGCERRAQIVRAIRRLLLHCAWYKGASGKPRISTDWRLKVVMLENSVYG